MPVSQKPFPPAGKPVKPVENAVRILRYLAGERGAARSAQIARDLRINPSTCFNILRTLAGLEMLTFDPASKTYRHGEGLLTLVEANAFDSHQLALTRPILHALASRHQVTATLWRRISAERLMMVAIEHSPTTVRIDIAPGQRLPAFMGATGRLVAAASGLEEEEMRALFETLRWARPIPFETYREQVRLARERGWAADEGYFSRGIMSIAAPVFDRQGSFTLALSAVTFLGDHADRAAERIGEDLIALARELSAKLY